MHFPPLEQRSFFVCYHWTAGLLRSSFLIRFPTICIQFVLFEPRTPWIPTHQCLLVPVPRARLCCRLQPDRCSSFSNCWQSGSCFAVARPAPDPASPCLLLRTSLLLHWYCSLARDIASIHVDFDAPRSLVGWLRHRTLNRNIAAPRPTIFRIMIHECNNTYDLLMTEKL